MDTCCVSYYLTYACLFPVCRKSQPVVKSENTGTKCNVIYDLIVEVLAKCTGANLHLTFFDHLNLNLRSYTLQINS